MSLVQTWSPFFQSVVRMQGRACFLQGSVRQLPPEAEEFVRAEVKDSEPALVTIIGENGSAQVSCSCGEFADGRYCKHIWATLLDVEENGTIEGRSNPESQVATEVMRPRLPKARRREGEREAPARRQPMWLDQLNLMRPPLGGGGQEPRPILPAKRLARYVVSVELSRHHGGVVVELYQEEPAGSGRRARAMKVSETALDELADPADRELCALLLGTKPVPSDEFGLSGSGGGRDRGHSAYQLPGGAQRALLKRMIATGRCRLHEGGVAEPTVLRWDDGGAWGLWLKGQKSASGLALLLELRRGGGEKRLEVLAVHEPALVLGGAHGLVIYGAKAAEFDDGGSMRWVNQFRDDYRAGVRGMAVPPEEVGKFLSHLYMLPNLPELDLPTDLCRPAQEVRPRAHLELLGIGPTAAVGEGASRHVGARVWFEYEGQRIRPGAAGRYITAMPTVEGEKPQEQPGPGAGAAAGGEAGRAGDQKWQAQTEGTILRRDVGFEQKSLAMLTARGFRQGEAGGEILGLAAAQVPRVVGELLAKGWAVRAEDRAVRSWQQPRLTVQSGIDWFELRGQVSYTSEAGAYNVDLVELLAAAQKGSSFVVLGDGTLGTLPQEWLNQHRLLMGVGKISGDHVRFRSSQAALLDMLLAGVEAVEWDERFAKIRGQLEGFERIEAQEPQASFQGTLRPYQKEGLGWLSFLRRFDLGGILADDMGLGKTVQVLAMMDARRKERLEQGSGGVGEDKQAMMNPPAEPGAEPSAMPGEVLGALPGAGVGGPTLVVAPRSVVFNWVDEAKRFTPQLRVQAYSGSGRETLREAFVDHDVIVTTYGLLRRDIAELRRFKFHYVVLDEAQTIKNPHSQGAKAARLLQADHRLALTGTPVENHLGDLWSIFEFLNPGMLGSGARFTEMLGGGGNSGGGMGVGSGASPGGGPGGISGEGQGNRNVELARQTGRALRPFILRRTKQQVLSELPEKTEQTLVCEMEGPQRAIYNRLRDHYRGLLLQGDGRGARKEGAAGGGAQPMLVLEALLRLRQAACHPGLIDEGRKDGPSAKLDALLEQLVELIEEGHKTLVFSQFTSFLALVRQRLDAQGIVYEYLDGKTRDREDRVQRFQTDPACPVFLISLKAGGLGLNLTAADYVFLLDPWWNPAVEQQAIDRTHRIGQTRRVFAYRLICQDTVEQRIGELQSRKRELAEAIMTEGDSVLRQLTREDLELLLS
ncbi:MAG: DEAD/DEAH box helicase [Phycisphaeraceae bacterium]|nr:DEAD/DEAH box helicase [Phycisphaeraceae bacterium]